MYTETKMEKMVMKTDIGMNNFHMTELQYFEIANVEIYEGLVKQYDNVFTPKRCIKLHDMTLHRQAKTNDIMFRRFGDVMAPFSRSE